MCSATHSSTAVGLLLWCQVPAPFNLEAVMKSKQDDPSALHVVLFQEVCACRLDAAFGPDAARTALHGHFSRHASVNSACSYICRL